MLIETGNNMNYELIRQLITYAEAYEQEATPLTTDDPNRDSMVHFVAWLNRRVSAEKQQVTKGGSVVQGGWQSPDILISMLVSFLYRYARALSKRALADTPLVSFDDFTYLAGLLGKPLQTKMELIQRNIHEKTTGMEIIKRLLANGLVEQQDDMVDKRSKRLKLTAAGFQILEKIWPVMSQVATLVGGTLPGAEKMHLVSLMDQLHQFHNPIFLNDKNEPIEELLKLIAKK